MKLTKEIQRMLNALAHANAGENLNLRQKARVLAGSNTPEALPASVVEASGPEVGLYLGSHLPADIMQYVIQTCTSMRRGLHVLTLQSRSEADSLLAPYSDDLAAANIKPKISVLTGEPPAALAYALRKRPEIAFLICNESGYLGRGLIKGSVAHDAIPVPVVLVAAGDSAASQQAEASKSQETKAA